MTRTINCHPAPNSLGYRLLKSRLEQKITRKKLIFLLEMEGQKTNVSLLSQWEAGKVGRHPFETVIAMAKALDVSLDYLAGFQQEYGTCPMNK